MNFQYESLNDRSMNSKCPFLHTLIALRIYLVDRNDEHPKKKLSRGRKKATTTRRSRVRTNGECERGRESIRKHKCKKNIHSCNVDERHLESTYR